MNINYHQLPNCLRLGVYHGGKHGRAEGARSGKVCVACFWTSSKRIVTVAEEFHLHFVECWATEALKHLNLLPIDGIALRSLGHARLNVRRVLGATDVPEAGVYRCFPSALSCVVYGPLFGWSDLVRRSEVKLSPCGWHFKYGQQAWTQWCAPCLVTSDMFWPIFPSGSRQYLIVLYDFMCVWLLMRCHLKLAKAKNCKLLPFSCRWTWLNHIASNLH